VGAVGLEPGDRFLLCMDGVTDGLFDSRIEDILRNTPREAAPVLVREAIATSGRDNAAALRLTRKSALLTSSAEQYSKF